MPDATRSQQPTLLEEVRQGLRLPHSSRHPERSSVEWIVRFHGMQSRQDLFPAAPKSAASLTGLAVRENGAPATQHQAMHALGWLSTRVRSHPLQGSIPAVHADKQSTVPVVMPREDVAAGLSLMDGTAHVVAKLRDGSGLRLLEAVRLRGKAMAEQMQQLTVRAGKGANNRCTTVPTPLPNFVFDGHPPSSTAPRVRKTASSRLGQPPDVLSRWEPSNAIFWAPKTAGSRRAPGVSYA